MDQKIENYIVDIIFATRNPEEYNLKELRNLRVSIANIPIKFQVGSTIYESIQVRLHDLRGEAEYNENNNVYQIFYRFRSYYTRTIQRTKFQVFRILKA